ncbi:MAG: hypothetical protein WBA44_05440 [Mesorhizobium sp.]
MPLDEAFLRRLSAASDKTLEIFVHHLVSLDTKTYRDHDCYGGSGDKGRDVAGFLTDRRHDGEWHNFQCKQYRRPLGADYVLLELGKIFHHAAQGAFILPSRYVFVVPGNLSASARTLIDRKDLLKKALLEGWETHCAKKIVKGVSIPVDEGIREAIESFNFDCVEAWESGRMLTLPNVVFAAAKAFGDDPGDAPQWTCGPSIMASSSGWSTPNTTGATTRMRPRSWRMRSMAKNFKCSVDAISTLSSSTGSSRTGSVASTSRSSATT